MNNFIRTSYGDASLNSSSSYLFVLFDFTPRHPNCTNTISFRIMYRQPASKRYQSIITMFELPYGSSRLGHLA
ncbi:uncharacterized protein VTP21DRAFT_5349 [Calcarisporiella thermophila]|uniref:uncharacterized protein n=1 Tax=Calcarisporiella thermophila TaxID=911321 RepID=UPI003743DF09